MFSNQNFDDEESYYGNLINPKSLLKNKTISPRNQTNVSSIKSNNPSQTNTTNKLIDIDVQPDIKAINQPNNTLFNSNMFSSNNIMNTPQQFNSPKQMDNSINDLFNMLKTTTNAFNSNDQPSTPTTPTIAFNSNDQPSTPTNLFSSNKQSDQNNLFSTNESKQPVQNKFDSNEQSQNLNKSNPSKQKNEQIETQISIETKPSLSEKQNNDSSSMDLFSQDTTDTEKSNISETNSEMLDFISQIEDQSVDYRSLGNDRITNFKKLYSFFIEKYKKNNIFDYNVRQMMFQKIKVFRELKKKVDEMGIEGFDFLFDSTDLKPQTYYKNKGNHFLKFLESESMTETITLMSNEDNQNETIIKTSMIKLPGSDDDVRVTMKTKSLFDYHNENDYQKMRDLYMFWKSKKNDSQFSLLLVNKLMEIVDSSEKYEPLNEWFNSVCLQVINYFVVFCPYVYFSTVEMKINEEKQTLQLFYVSVEEHVGQAVDEKIMQKNKQDNPWEFEEKCDWMESVFFHLVFMLKIAQNVFEFVHFDLSPNNITFKKSLTNYDINYEIEHEGKSKTYSIKDQKYIFFLKDFEKSFIRLTESTHTGNGLRSVRAKYESSKKMETLYYADMLLLVKKYLSFLDKGWIDQWIKESKTKQGIQYIDTNIFCLIVKNLLSCDKKMEKELYPSKLLCSEDKRKWIEETLGLKYPFSSFYSCLIDDGDTDNNTSMKYKMENSKTKPHKDFIIDHSFNVSESCKTSTVSKIIDGYFKKYEINK